MAKTREVVQFTIGDRTYELVPFLKEGESSVTGDTMVERARELDANLGKEDCQFILEHQDEIPQEFRWWKFYLVFPAWRGCFYPREVAFLYWGDYSWRQSWGWLEGGWVKFIRLVRRVS